MKILGLICEYNPFHNGHLLHLEQSKKITSSEYVMVVMSGNFVQRGEPAIFNKYMRTKMALLNGADIVIELPLYSATSSAEYFAQGAIKLLDSTNIVSSICFGSEIGDLLKLNEISDLLVNEPIEFKNLLKFNLKDGTSYPKARAKTLSKLLNIDENIINSPNNILGIEYLKALKKLNSKMKPYTIERLNDYNSNYISSSIASATSIRQNLIIKNISNVKRTIPSNCFDIIIDEIEKNNIFPDIDNFSNILHFILKTKSPEYISTILDVTEGLENRILSSKDFLIKDMLDSIKTKRYTHAKLRRALLHIILDIKKAEFENYNQNSQQYIRILGFNKKNQFLLKYLQESCNIPILTNLKYAQNSLNEYQFNLLKKEIISTDIYYLSQNIIKTKNVEYKNPLVII